MKLIIRLLAFFGKELNEVRRQPRLLLSLLVGPFLILLLFGVGYRGEPPTLRIGLVIPESLQGDPRAERVREVLADNFNIVYEGPDPEPALQLLANEQVDLVEILPGNLEEKLQAGEQAPLTFVYNEINPQEEQYLKFSAYTQVDAINQVVVMESVQDLQRSSSEISRDLERTDAALAALEEDPEAGGQDPETRESIRSASGTLAALAASPALAAAALADPDVDSSAGQDMTTLSEDLAELDRSLEQGEVGPESDIRDMRERLRRLNDTLTEVSRIPPNVFVSPLAEQYENLQGESLDLMRYFAPGVAALILQHIAVTLGALSLVREHRRGSFEFFGVAPVSILQVLFGKYLAYMVYVGIITAGLVALMVWPLNVPFLGDPWLFVGLMALFLFGAISVGFLISIVSNSDTQAVQLAMLVLLLSIFFSGFILPLENFSIPVRYVGYIVPMTPAMEGIQDIMLYGTQPSSGVWVVLGLLGVVTFLLVTLFGYRRFRRPL